MDIVKRLLGMYLLGTGAAVFLNLMLTPLYHDASPDYPVWDVLNWFMAAGTLIALAFSAMRKWSGRDGDSLQSNAAFYGAVALTMLFFWQWFWLLNPESETGEAVVISHIAYFPAVDALYTVVAVGVGSRLLRGVGEAEGGA